MFFSSSFLATLEYVLWARFHYERGTQYFLFVDFFASLKARLDFKCGKIDERKKRKNPLFQARSENEP